eukprot:365377-Chlamydomonas_euryale.AAC.26
MPPAAGLPYTDAQPCPTAYKRRVQGPAVTGHIALFEPDGRASVSRSSMERLVTLAPSLPYAL